MKNIEMKTRGTKSHANAHQRAWALKKCYKFNYPPDKIKEKPALDERKNQANLSDDEKTRFKTAYQTIISTGQLGPIVAIHGDMSHMMHGTERFLPWHRVYLDVFEQALQSVDSDVVLPYWDWTVDQIVPAWLEVFTPTVVVNGNPVVVTRTPGLQTPSLPPPGDVTIVNNLGTFPEFTAGLEGGTAQTQTGMHNTVHVWVGGPMGIIDIAPVDTLFWLNHANIDRLWDNWQKQHPNLHPNLSGIQAIMDPWSVTEETTRETANFGYKYV